MAEVVIEASDLTLEFPVLGLRARRMAAAQASTPRQVGGRLRRTEDGKVTVIALEGVSFQVRAGDRVGLIGRNGAGKSSLLRVLGGIYRPSAGRCYVAGRVSTLFSSALGLNPNATGYENIRLACTLLGTSPAALQAALPEIVEFCELGEFLDMPLRTYSSGMRTRLGFAIATAMNPDVLLIDEVFGAGDRYFRDKAKLRLEGVMRQSQTLVLASHSGSIIRKFCNKALWLEQGVVRGFGEVGEVLAAYNQSSPKRKREAPARRNVRPARRERRARLSRTRPGGKAASDA